MKHFILRYYQEILLSLLMGVIFVINITPNAYLTGWDSLQTELDPILGIKRSVFSVWQEYQSFGLTAGMAHGADLVRSIVIFPMTLLLPDWTVRYTFHVAMILIGGFGMLKLLRFSLKDNTHSPFPLLGSLFYMFNFAILQLLFLPFEAFSIFFASLPWLIWIYIKLITKPSPLKPRQLLLFIILNLLATPAFVAQQLFVVYGMILGFLTIGIISPTLLNAFQNTRKPRKTSESENLKIRQSEKSESPSIPSFLKYIKRSLIAAILVIAINSFWLLPQGYFLLTNGSVVRESKINQIATSDVLYSNIDRGNLTDLISFNGFFYDRLAQDQSFLFASWRLHRENPFMIGVIYLLFAIVLLGIFSKERYSPSNRPVQIGFLLIFLLCGIALLGNTPGIKELNDLIRENSFINQIFRSPFTKFAVPLALSSSYFFTVGLVTLYTFLLHVRPHGHMEQHARHHDSTETKSKNTFLLWLFSLVVAFLILFQALPVFQGQLFSREMKIEIPTRYLELMDYFASVDTNQRIALLPDYTFWGWFNTDYGYNGSGYLWYGIEQPIVSRNFDYWSFESESYFWEIKNAVEAEDAHMMENVFEKYDIDFLVLDESLLPIVATQKALQYDNLKRMLDQSTQFTRKKTWDGLVLYKRDAQKNQQAFISLASAVPNIGPHTKLLNDDIAYETYGTYQTDSSKPFDVYYPFLDLFTQTKNVSDRWEMTESEASILVESSLPFNPTEYEATTASQTTVDLYNDETAINYIIPFETSVETDSVRVRFPKIRIDSFSAETANIGYCLKPQGELSSYKSQQVIDITSSQGATGCIDFVDPNLDQRYGYLVSTQTENVNGPPLYFYILDTTKNQAYVEDRILSNSEFFILGPHFNRGLGYSFTFQNTSYQHIPSTNRVIGLHVYLMPYKEIHSFELIRKTSTPIQTAQFETNFIAEKKNYYTYTLTDFQSRPDQTLILYQSYQPGWKAYTLTNSKWQMANGLMEMFPFLFGTEIKDHVEINNWANGWNLPRDKQYAISDKLVIIYLPQYLQYAGFGILFVTIAIIALASFRGKKRQ